MLSCAGLAGIVSIAAVPPYNLPLTLFGVYAIDQETAKPLQLVGDVVEGLTI